MARSSQLEARSCSVPDFGLKFFYVLLHQILFMKVVDIKVLRGPNYWSIKRHKLIQMTLDIEELEQKPTNEIPGFFERLKNLLPSL